MTAARRIRLTDDIAPAAADIHTDRSRLMQVLYNFVSNALKFTAEGGHVHIRASLEGPDHVRMEVEDDGIGIDAQDFDRLFVEFQQLEAGAAKRFGGTGLGLALTKRIVEAQGGRVGVESVRGRGSTFHAVLPRRAPESA
jgi:signal transduction histidine kinase